MDPAAMNRAVDLGQRNRRLAWRLGLAALVMSGFGYALAPLYDRLCRALGLDRANAALVNDAARNLRVELDANVASGLPVRFTALEPVQTVHAGATLRGRFLLENLSDRPLSVEAIPSYAPVRAAGVLQKIDCFCFSGMTLAAFERREVSVLLLVSRELPADMGAATLSYQLRPDTGKS